MSGRLKVICDNNVWFQIDDEKNPLVLNHKDHIYVSTAINLYEFITDEHKYKTPIERIKLNNAIKAMHKNCSEFIFEDPMVYAATRLSKAPILPNLKSEILDIYDKLVLYAGDKIQKLHGPTINEILKAKSDFKEDTRKMAIRYNELAEEFKTKERQKLERIQNLSIDWLYNSMSKVMEHEIEYEQGQDLKGVDIFLRSYSLALHRINEDTGPKSNTIFDLLQLLYLANNEIDLFWTLDGQISKRINYLDNMFSANDKQKIKNDHR